MEVNRDALWSKRCGWAVVLGLAIEVAIAIVYQEHVSWLQNWLPVAADILVALGVWGEIHFADKVSRQEEAMRLDAAKQIAEAQRQAAESLRLAEEERHARVKLEAQLAMREITPEQYEALGQMRGKVSAVNITTMGTFEATRYAAQIAKALADAGIKVMMCEPRIGMVWAGLHLVVPAPIENFSQGPIWKGFKDAGLTAGCSDRRHHPLSDLRSEIPVLMVGDKPPPPSERPPYVLTLPPNTDDIISIVA